MNSRSFRLVIVLAVVSISGILVIQIFWMGKAFDIRNKQFNHNVNLALLNTASTLCDINQLDLLPDQIEQLSANYFIVNINNRIAPEILETILIREFQQRQITEAFEYGIFDCTSKEMVYGRYVDLTENNSNQELTSSFPKLTKDAYYFGVYFPNKPSNLAGEMWIWAFSSLVLVIVVLFFGYALYAIFRQKQLSEIQRDFINNMTHEFKTPISTIALSSDVLQSEQILQQPKRLAEYAGIVKKEATRLHGLVDKVLQTATIENALPKLKKSEVDVNELIARAIESIRISLDEKKGKIYFDGQASNAVVWADQLHMTNIVYNLLDNAIKYNDRIPEVKIATLIKKDKLIISIEDNGKGISKKELALIFRKFYRVPTGNLHDIKGFGLGLFYVKKIIEAHGGSITVDSSDQGSTFTITLPIKND